MTQDQIIVHYGELSTKGRNRKDFQQKLADHIRFLTKQYESVKVSPRYDYLHVTYSEPIREELLQILAEVPGIARFQPVYKTEKTIEAMNHQAIALFNELSLQSGDTFAVVARRQDKQFPLDTYGIQREVGAAIGRAFPQLSVNLDEPTHRLMVNVHVGDYAYLSLVDYEGVGGLPFGTSGKGMLMLSGGIDSPVAGYELIKRGMELEAVHFSSPPYTSPKAYDKVKRLAAQIGQYGKGMVIHNVPFTKIQETIKDVIPDAASMTVTRRMMLLITERLMHQRRGQAIVNGESLGQVASQTMESMVAINAVTNVPILRPLIAMDKNDIIKIADDIGTYHISNEPFEDACTVFAPQSPHTRPKVEDIEKLEERLNIAALIDEAVSQTEREFVDLMSLEQAHQTFDDLL